MKPELDKFEAETKIPVIHIDIDHKASDLYAKYGKLFPNRGTPHIVILDDKDRTLYSQPGLNDCQGLKIALDMATMFERREQDKEPKRDGK